MAISKKKKAAGKAKPQKKAIKKNVKKAAPKRKVRKTAVKPAQVKSLRLISPEERMHMIAVAAYQRAERRGFIDGNPEEDWFEAEKEIESLLSSQGKK